MLQKIFSYGRIPNNDRLTEWCQGLDMSKREISEFIPKLQPPTHKVYHLPEPKTAEYYQELIEVNS
jgi:hypothetical protein